MFLIPEEPRAGESGCESFLPGIVNLLLLRKGAAYLAKNDAVIFTDDLSHPFPQPNAQE
jgi:hypothetical protein